MLRTMTQAIESCADVLHGRVQFMMSTVHDFRHVALQDLDTATHIPAICDNGRLHQRETLGEQVCVHA